MNEYDSELVRAMLIKEGLHEVTSFQNADIMLVNTCSIREGAETKVHSRLGNFYAEKQKNPKTMIGVLGCMAQSLKDDLLENKPYVDIILGPDTYSRLPEYIRRNTIKNHVVDTKLSKMEVYKGHFPARTEGFNAWIAITRGCDKFCSFCIVPFTRGRERSRTLKSILDEVRQAVDAGFVEITLLGQNVNSYRHDSVNFSQLLQETSQIEGVKRVRFTSPHPSDCGDDLIEVIAKEPKICNSVHLPLQAGSNRILKRMNRTYTQREFIGLVEKFRKAIPDIGISTDIITGFPGETDEEFEQTLYVMETVQFDSAFMFKYSSRPGTKAESFSNHITEDVKSERLQKIIALQKTHTLEQNKKMVGKIVDVLIEKESRKSENKFSGRTDNNKIVVFDRLHFKSKEIIPVKIVDAQGVTLFGEPVLHNSKMEGS